MEEVDLADLVGMEDTRYAVEVAAAGGHHLLLSGPNQPASRLGLITRPAFPRGQTHAGNAAALTLRR